MVLYAGTRLGTFRQLEILLTVYHFKTIKLASEKLHLTQPTVSMQLKKLANTVGMPLYDQIGKELVFTEAGKTIASAAEKVLERMQQLDMDLSELRGIKSGTLKLSVVTTAKYFIPHLLGPFCKRYPNVDVELNVGNRQQIINRLDKGNDDFYVFSNVPSRQDIDAIDLLDNPLVAIAHENHPLADKKQLTLKDIQDEPFLMREKGSGTRFATEAFLEQREVKMNVKMTIESNMAIKHSVMSGMGIAILSAHTIAFGESAGISILDIKDMPILSKWYFVRNKAKRLSPLAQAFLDYTEQEGKNTLLKDLNLDGII
jgi:DNA-binding transcriptional LysR family regulator